MPCSVGSQVDGYLYLEGWRAPLASNASLGVVQGDDAHCRRVCTIVGGCNVITRAGRLCLLSTECPQLPQRPASNCLDGAVTMVASPCRPASKWRRLTYPIPAKREGSHIAVVTMQNTTACERACEVTPSCNSFRYKTRHFKRPYPRKAVECHLKMGCLSTRDPDVIFEHSAAAAFAKVCDS